MWQQDEGKSLQKSMLLLIFKYYLNHVLPWFHGFKLPKAASYITTKRQVGPLSASAFRNRHSEQIKPFFEDVDI